MKSFSRKIIFSKIFSKVWLARKKKYESENVTAAGIQQRLVALLDYGEYVPDQVRSNWILAGLLQIRPNPNHFVQIWPNQWTDSGAGRIPTA
jgi:hypothetical protein